MRIVSKVAPLLRLEISTPLLTNGDRYGCYVYSCLEKLVVEKKKSVKAYATMPKGSQNPYNLVPRVFRLFGQRGNAGKTLGTLKKFNFFDWLFRNGFHCFTAEILP